MARIETTPILGFLFELGYIFITIISAILMIQGESNIFPTFFIFCVLSIINFKQILRFCNKTRRKYEGKYMTALKILRSDYAKDEQKKKAFNMLIECANGGYEPAKLLLSQITQQNQATY